MRAKRMIAVCVLLSGFAYPQDPAPSGAASQNTASEDHEAIRQLLMQVRKLQEQVSALETKPVTVETATDSAPAQPVSSFDGDGASQAADFREHHDFRGIRWRGFGEVNYRVLDQKQSGMAAFGSVPGSAGNFYTGDFDLFLTSKITDRTSLLAEVVIGEGDAQSFGIDLARALLKYDYNDHLRLKVGRYQTAIGFYNTAFHSGRWLQTTVDRPLVMELAEDGGLLPTKPSACRSRVRFHPANWD